MATGCHLGTRLCRWLIEQHAALAYAVSVYYMGCIVSYYN